MIQDLHEKLNIFHFLDFQKNPEYFCLVTFPIMTLLDIPGFWNLPKDLQIELKYKSSVFYVGHRVRYK